jgi:hypothetical protein
MTNDSLPALIRADIDAFNRDNSMHDSSTFVLAIELMRSATAELTSALALVTAPDYYFSDSSFDETNNPAQTIADCNAIISALFNDDTIDDDLIQMFVDDIDAALDYALTDPDDDNPAPASLADTIARLRA